MKLRTSFFNIYVLKKNLIRFAPLWVLYAVGEVLGLLTMDPGNSAYRIVDDLRVIMGPVCIFHAVYALLVAACLFGDLFDSRLCNGLHAMPMRREGWLLTNLVSGLVFALIPALVGGGFGAFILREYWWIALVWQLTSLLQFLFFFGVAVFSAMCAGKRLGMAAVYALVNFLSMLIYWLVDILYAPLIPGVVPSVDLFKLFSPIATICQDSYFDLTIHYTQDLTKVVFEGYTLSAWYYLLICVGVGLVFTVLAWLLYRKRHLESAGDFISLRPMRIFFLVGYSLAAGTLLYAILGSLFGMDVDFGFLAAGVLIGYFTGWMLLERTVKVFTKKVLVGFAAFAVLFAGSIGLTVADPLGIGTYIPAAEKIESVSLYPTEKNYIYTMQRDFSGWNITDPAEIAQVQQLHEKMLPQDRNEFSESVRVDITYRLKNGTEVYRSYKVPAESAVAEELSGFLSDVRAVFHTSDWEELVENTEEIRIYMDDSTDYEYVLLDPAQQQALLEAIRLDADAGNMAQPNNLHRYEDTVAAIDVKWLFASPKAGIYQPRWEMLRVYDGCENTVAFLETLE